jgi:hypothetical protein
VQFGNGSVHLFQPALLSRCDHEVAQHAPVAGYGVDRLPCADDGVVRQEPVQGIVRRSAAQETDMGRALKKNLLDEVFELEGFEVQRIVVNGRVPVVRGIFAQLDQPGKAEVLVHVMELVVKDELSGGPGRVFRSRGRIGSLGLVHEKMGSVDHVHGQKSRGQTGSGAEELATADAHGRGKAIGQLVQRNLDQTLSMVLRRRVEFAIGKYPCR